MLSGLAQAQVVANPDLEFTGQSPAFVPNDRAPDAWDQIGTSDVAWRGLDVDCAFILEESGNGDWWARMVSDEGIASQVSGLVPGGVYWVSFEQALVLHWARSVGHFEVTFDGVTLAAPSIPLPDLDPSQTPWDRVEVGPFTVGAAGARLSFVAISEGGGTDPTGGAFIQGCGYARNPTHTDLMIDGISVQRDPPPHAPTVDALVSPDGRPPLTGTLDPVELDAFEVQVGVDVWTWGVDDELVVTDADWRLDLTSLDVPLRRGQYDVRARETDAVGQHTDDVTRFELVVQLGNGEDTGLPPVPTDATLTDVGADDTGDQPDRPGRGACGCSGSGSPGGWPLLVALLAVHGRRREARRSS